MNPVLEKVTADIIERSRESRSAYLAGVDAAVKKGPYRSELACGRLQVAYRWFLAVHFIVMSKQLPLFA